MNFDTTEPQMCLNFKSKPIPFSKYKSFHFYQMVIELEHDRTMTLLKWLAKWNETLNIDIKAWEERTLSMALKGM